MCGSVGAWVCEVLRARSLRLGDDVTPFQGLGMLDGHCPQGVALGWYITPFQSWDGSSCFSRGGRDGGLAVRAGPRGRGPSCAPEEEEIVARLFDRLRELGG